MLDNYIHGASQESGRRAGTENVLLVVGLGAAADIALRERDALHQHMLCLRDHLQQRLESALPKVRACFARAARSTHTPCSPDMPQARQGICCPGAFTGRLLL